MPVFFSGFPSRSGRGGGHAVAATALIAATAAASFAPRAARAQTPAASPPANATPLGAQPPGPAQDPLAGPIRRNDQLRVDVVGDAKLTGPQRVDREGFITLPLAGRIRVFGLSPAQAADRITRTLQTKQLLRRPQVTVTIVDRPALAVSVSGAVTTQGRTVIRENTRLNEVLEPAGLINGASDLKRVVITRTQNNSTRDITVDYSAYREGRSNGDANNPLLQDNDKVYVYSNAPVIGGTVTVSGAVAKTGPLQFPKGTTAFQAIQLAGGLALSGGPNGFSDLGADKDRIVVRRSGTEIAVPYKQVSEGATEKDITLQDRDEIFVPRLQNSQVSQSKQFQVIGAVNNKQTFYPLERRTTLQEAVVAAGGPVDGAKDFAIKVTRLDANRMYQSKTYNLKKSADASVEIQAGDIINVPGPSRNPQTLGSTIGILSGLAGLAYLFGRR